MIPTKLGPLLGFALLRLGVRGHCQALAGCQSGLPLSASLSARPVSAAAAATERRARAFKLGSAQAPWDGVRQRPWAAVRARQCRR
jgi:hypothetical protein